MARQVVWNKKARIKFNEIVDYLESEVSEKAAVKFVVRVDNLIEKLLRYPEIGRKSKRKTVRQHRIDKYNKLYYRKNGSRLTIVFIFDDRQDPNSNPYS